MACSDILGVPSSLYCFITPHLSLSLNFFSVSYLLLNNKAGAGIETGTALYLISGSDSLLGYRQVNV